MNETPEPRRGRTTSGDVDRPIQPPAKPPTAAAPAEAATTAAPEAPAAESFSDRLGSVGGRVARFVRNAAAAIAGLLRRAATGPRARQAAGWARSHTLWATAIGTFAVCVLILGLLWWGPLASHPSPTSAPTAVAPTAAVPTPRVTASSQVTVVPTATPVPVRPSGSLDIARSNQIALALAKGKTLILGGCDANGQGVASAEVYNTDTGKFDPAAPMSVGRCGASATGLKDGRILIVGGMDEQGRILSSAELYDPAKGTTTATEPMATTRMWHSAVLLANGQVLVAGGRVGPTMVTAQSELWDPKTGKFDFTGSMKVARENAGSILLRDGRVLIVGGDSAPASKDSPAQILASAETFNIKSKAWTATPGSMPEPRQRPTVLMLANGQFLVLGGRSSDKTAVATILAFDARGGRFTDSGNFTEPREGQSVTLLKDGRLLIAGGRTGAGDLLATVEVCDRKTMTCRQIALLPEGRADHSASIQSDGALLIAGGHIGAPTGGAGAAETTDTVRMVLPRAFGAK